MPTKSLLFLTSLLFLGLGCSSSAPVSSPTKNLVTLTKTMQLTSPAFSNGGDIPSVYTCDDRDVNPPLSWTGIPSGTKSLALVVDDPDAPAGTWTHWIVWNINPATTGVAENSVPPAAMEGVTSFGKTGWGGPCPPSGVHRYFFKLYALDTTLPNLTSASSAEELTSALTGHILESGELMGKYKRKK